MKNRVLFFCFLWNELQGFLAEDGIGATRVPTGNLYSAEISTFINLDAANIWQDFKTLPILQNVDDAKRFFQRGSILVIIHMILDWSVNNVKEGRNLFSYSLSHRTEEREVSHMICESLVNPKKSSRWKRCPNFDWKSYVSDEHFQFSGPSLPFPYQQNLI